MEDLYIIEARAGKRRGIPPFSGFFPCLQTFLKVNSHHTGGNEKEKVC